MTGSLPFPPGPTLTVTLGMRGQTSVPMRLPWLALSLYEPWAGFC